MAPALGLGTTPGTGRFFKLSSKSLGSAPKITGLCRHHRGFARFRSCTPSVLSVVSPGGFFGLFLLSSWQVRRQKHAQAATSDLNEIFKNCQPPKFPWSQDAVTEHDNIRLDIRQSANIQPGQLCSCISVVSRSKKHK